MPPVSTASKPPARPDYRDNAVSLHVIAKSERIARFQQQPISINGVLQAFPASGPTTGWPATGVVTATFRVGVRLRLVNSGARRGDGAPLGHRVEAMQVDGEGAAV
jgi:hypothetical protein